MRPAIATAAALFALTAFAQADVEQVFHLTSSTAATQDLNQIATMIRSIAEIKQVSVDPNLRNFSVRGTAEQISLARWMFNELDQIAGRPARPDLAQRSDPGEFRLSGADDNVVRIFYVPNTATVQDFQEVATMMRSIGEIRRVFTYNTCRAIAVRGTDEQIALAAWMLDELDKHAQPPANSNNAESSQFRMSGGDVAQILYLTHTATVQNFQEAATLIRTMAQILRVFTWNAPRALALRATPDRIALAEWLFHELDQAATRPRGASQQRKLESREYPGPAPGGETVRLFYLGDACNPKQLQQLVSVVRGETNIRWAFAYNALSAVAFRGTPAQVAMAEQLLKERSAQ